MKCSYNIHRVFIMRMTLVFVLLFMINIAFSAQKNTLKTISLAPNITEMIYAIGEGHELIANTRQCDFPEVSKKLTKIGDLANVNIEKIVALKPDIVIASMSGNSRDQAERIRSLGIKVLTLKESSIEDILSNTVLLGKLFNRDVSFPMKVFRQKLGSVKFKPKKKNALLLVSAFPFYGVSTNTFLGDVLNKAGFNNTVHTAVRYPALSQEELTLLRPDIVIISDRYRYADRSIRELFKRMGLEPQFVYLNEDRLSRPGPRIFDTIIELSRFN